MTLCATMLLGACAVVTPADPGSSADMLSGRLAVRVDGADNTAARSLSAGFELRGDAALGRLSLSSPLGSVLAQARWSPAMVVLATPQGETRFADLDALTRELLGESLPIAALFDWLRGRPWPDAPSTATVTPAEPGFQQLGWVVNLAHFDDAWVIAQRASAPVVTVRVKIDRP
jgi:outer membrane lipoprotein LolB